MTAHVALHTVPADAYPFTVAAYLPDGTCVWDATVHGPGDLHIPALGKRYGQHISIVIVYADGETVVAQ